MLLVAEKRFRRLKDPRLTRDLYLRAKLEDAVAIQPATEEKVTRAFYTLIDGTPIHLGRSLTGWKTRQVC